LVRLEHLLIVFLLLELRLWEVELRLLSLHHLQSVVNGIEVLLLVLVLCFLLGLFPFLFDLLFLIVEELLVLN